MIEIGKKYVVSGHPVSQNNGIIILVLGFYCKAGEYKDGEWWHSYLGDRFLIDSQIKSLHGHHINHIGELNLKPIDDDWNNISSWDECVWQPDHTREYSD